jgi:hypothetical protein
VWNSRENRVRTRGEEKGRSGIPHPELLFFFLVGNGNCARSRVEIQSKTKMLKYPVTALGRAEVDLVLKG